MSAQLLLVAVKTDQPNLAQRLQAVLALAEPADAVAFFDSQPCAWTKAVSDLEAQDLDRLAQIVGWDAVRRLGIGDVAVAQARLGGPGGASL